MNRPSEPGDLARRAVAAAAGRALLLVLDFDGTLAEIVDDPDDALLLERARAALSVLGRGAESGAHVAIVSGRALEDLRSRASVPGVALAGEHGADLLLPGGERLELEPGARAKEVLERFARTADGILSGTGGHVERKRVSVAAHTRRVRENAAPLER
ncbi:trehalose-phosphatase, partial [bacterium]|nr:trehalose-phosphatase [bacterium]